MAGNGLFAMISPSPRSSFVAWRLERAQADAYREDVGGRGIPVDRALNAELDRIRRSGWPLPARLAKQAGRFLRRDLAEVRLHAGNRVDQLTALFDAPAFCVGSDIFLDQRVLRSGRPGLAFDVLAHELAHIANGPEPGLVRCWERQGHEELTVQACNAFSKQFDEIAKIASLHISKARLVEGLKIACSNMDFRQRVFHPLDTASYLLGYFVHIPFLAKGEGPRHGEGLNYTEIDPGPNIQANLKQQREEINEAVKGFAFDKQHDADDWLPTAHLGAVALNEKEWVKSLGNALHTAQDRAAHREGRKNFGHCDRRVASGWGPDDPKNDDHHAHDGEAGGSWWICNVAAFNKGFNNSCEVLEEFFKRVGIPMGPPWQRKAEFHGSVGTRLLHGSFHDDSDALLEPNPWWHHGCVYGRRPAPIGWR